MGVSVVVCARNEENYIETCLKCLKNQILKPEIIVVDGHSIDKTVSIARKYADKVVEDNGRGLGDARNVGWKKAKGDIIAYCDADSRPPLDWTLKISKLMKNNSCISGPLFPYDSGTIIKIHLKIWAYLFPTIFSFLGHNYLWGANMAFRKEVLKKNSFKLSFLEDYEIGKRLRRSTKVKFSRELVMAISSRRFEGGFIKTSFKYYVINFIRINLRYGKLKSYYQ